MMGISSDRLMKRVEDRSTKLIHYFPARHWRSLTANKPASNCRVLGNSKTIFICWTKRRHQNHRVGVSVVYVLSSLDYKIQLRLSTIIYSLLIPSISMSISAP